MSRLLDSLFAFCASLRLAVIVILSLATLLGVATFYEARYGGPAVQAQIYGSRLFIAVLAMLAINVMSSALIRFPWKRKQTGFVVTHLGILTLLAGCLISYRGSIDGRLMLRAGSASTDFATNDEKLQVSLAGKNLTLPAAFWTEAGYPTATEALTFRWGDPAWRGEARRYDVAPGATLEVLRWLPAARFDERIVPDPAAGPIAQVRLLGTTPNGQPVDQVARLTPGDTSLFGGIIVANLLVDGDLPSFLDPKTPAPTLTGTTRGRIEFLPAGDKFYFRAFNKDGLRAAGEVRTGEQLVKYLAISVSSTGFWPHARVEQGYVPAHISPKKMADAPRAARVALTVDGQRSELWIARGAPAATLDTPRGPATLAYGFAAQDLPFSISLLTARKTNKPGTADPDAYESDVLLTLPDGAKPQSSITMNRPLTQNGFTFYQSALDDSAADPISTLAIRKDPGTYIKYAGSALICTGIFLMFYMKSYFSKPIANKPVRARELSGSAA